MVAEAKARAEDYDDAIRLAKNMVYGNYEHMAVFSLARIAMIAARAGERDAAEKALETSQRQLSGIDRPYDQVRALLELAAANLAIQDRDTAHKMISDARGVYDPSEGNSLLAHFIQLAEAHQLAAHGQLQGFKDLLPVLLDPADACGVCQILADLYP